MSTVLTDAISRYAHLKKIWDTCGDTLKQFNKTCRVQYNLIEKIVGEVFYDCSLTAAQATLDKAMWCIISLIMGKDMPLTYFEPHNLPIDYSEHIVSDFRKFYQDNPKTYTSYMGYDECNRYDYTDIVSLTLFNLLKNKNWVHENPYYTQYFDYNTDISDCFENATINCGGFCDEELADSVDGVIVQKPYLDEFFSSVYTIVNYFFSNSVSEKIVQYLKEHPETFLSGDCVIDKTHPINNDLPSEEQIVFWYNENIIDDIYGALINLMDGSIVDEQADTLRKEVFLQIYDFDGLSDAVIAFLMQYPNDLLARNLNGQRDASSSPSLLISKALGFFLSFDKKTLESYDFSDDIRMLITDFKDILDSVSLKDITMFFASSADLFIQPCVVDGYYVSGTHASGSSCYDGCNMRNINVSTILLLEMADTLYQIVEECRRD